jgi:hypothetical protein
MLTNTATAANTQDRPEITATTIAIEAAEARCRAALRDLARLADGEQISTIEAGRPRSLSKKSGPVWRV